MPTGRNPVDEFIPVARLSDMVEHPGTAYAYDGTSRAYPDIRPVYWVGGDPNTLTPDLGSSELAQGPGAFEPPKFARQPRT